MLGLEFMFMCDMMQGLALLKKMSTINCSRYPFSAEMSPEPLTKSTHTLDLIWPLFCSFDLLCYSVPLPIYLNNCLYEMVSI
jgi:hypothetical protein